MKELIQEIWSLFNNKYNDASRYEEHDSDIAENVLSDVQSLIELHEIHDKYRWHDLRKNPDDLPQLLQEVLVCTKDSYGNIEYSIGCKVDQVPREGHIVVNGWSCLGIPIAWKYIEPFEVEE